MIPLKRIRTEKGVTQEWLSMASKVAQPTISDIERGVTVNPGFQTVLQLAKALGCEPVDLLSNEKQDKPKADPERGETNV